MIAMIDLHCHILPGMDDGPSTMEESLSMIETAVKEGIITIVATPHLLSVKHAGHFVNERDEKTNEINLICAQKGLKINILKSAELYIEMDLLNLGNLEKLTINGTRYILTELPMTGLPLYTEEYFYRLQLKGFLPIIAHPERNSEIIKKPEILYRLVELGSLVQINTGSITGLYGPSAQKSAHTILSSDMAHVVATDAHSNYKRNPEIKSCIKMLSQWVGKDKTRELMSQNPAAILDDKDLV